MFWMNATLLLIFVAGHTTLWISGINRLHGLPWHDRTLKPIRHLHDFAIVAFPCIVLWRVGLTGPKLLLGGSWSALDAFWQVVFCICTLGVFGLAWAIVRHLAYRPPRQQIRQQSTVTDIARQLGSKPIGHGPHSRLVRFPGNEQFSVELSQKTFLLPQLPVEWNGLSILHLSDWHFSGTIRKEYFEQAAEIASREEVDLVCFTGDLLDNPALVDWLPSTLDRIPARLGRYFILGNHDWYSDFQPTRAKLTGLGWHDLGSRCEVLEINGRRLAIGGDETPWIGEHPTFPGDADFLLLLSHAPDTIAWARAQGVDLMLAGHNHGGQVRIPGLGAVFSPSLYGCKYASGTFYEAPTLLHVSRGLAGIHPLRYRCRPEMTRLILQSGG